MLLANECLRTEDCEHAEHDAQDHIQHRNDRFSARKQPVRFQGKRGKRGESAEESKNHGLAHNRRKEQPAIRAGDRNKDTDQKAAGGVHDEGAGGKVFTEARGAEFSGERIRVLH